MRQALPAGGPGNRLQPQENMDSARRFVHLSVHFPVKPRCSRLICATRIGAYREFGSKQEATHLHQW
jgi:hypothetical protein